MLIATSIAATPPSAADLPAQFYICRNIDLATGEESFTVSRTRAVFADGELVGVYALTRTDTIRCGTHTRGSLRAELAA